MTNPELTTEHQKRLNGNDADVERVLNSISAMRHENDSLTLDKQRLEDQLVQSDATISALRSQLSSALTQRDAFMTRLVELTTYFSVVRDAVKQSEKAFSTVARAESLSVDDGAAAIASRFAPETLESK
jgi:chromosome segregation ATPase